MPEPSDSKDEQELYVPANNEKVIRKFSSVELYNPHHHKDVYYRQLEFPLTVNGKIYKVDVRKSQEETEDIVQLSIKNYSCNCIIITCNTFCYKQVCIK